MRRNKGMALFPKRIDGRFAMISRIDNENLYYTFCEIICQMPVKFGCFSEVTLSSAGRI